MSITKAQAMFLNDLREKTVQAGKQLKALQKMLVFPQTVQDIESTQTAVLLSETAARAAMAKLAEADEVEKEKKVEETKVTGKKK